MDLVLLMLSEVEGVVGQVEVKQGQMGHFKRTFLGTQFEANVV